MIHTFVVCVLLLLLSACMTPKRVVATIPSGGSIAEEVVKLNCGVVAKCDVSDLGRIFLIEQNKNTYLFQAPITNSDLPKLLKCGEQFICTIAPMTVTIIKNKKK